MRFKYGKDEFMKVVLRLKLDVSEINMFGFFLFFVDCGSWYDILKFLKMVYKREN